MAQIKKNEVELLILDIDNTLVDFYNPVLETTDWAVSELAKSRDVKPEKIFDYIDAHKQEMSTEVRFHNIEKLIKSVPFLHQPKDEEEAARFKRDDARIVHEVNRKRENVPPYKGVLATLNKAVKAGTKIAFYSDSPKAPALMRVARLGIDPENIAAFCVRDDHDETPVSLNEDGKIGKFAAALEEKTSYNTEYKPNPDRVTEIMTKLGVKDPKRVVLVGDNMNADGKSAVGAGVNFAWQKQGATITPRNLEVYDSLCAWAHYKIGAKAQEEKISDENRPTVILEKSFADLNKHYDFISADYRTDYGRGLLLSGLEGR